MNEPGGDAPTPIPEAGIPQQRPWRRRWQVYAVVGWSSFLAASVATMLFFAFFDPAEYQWMGGESVEDARMTGYALGFFFFWLVTALTGAVVAYLINSTRRESRRRRARDRKSANGS
jgi:H+/Cl- antiporter ClcA